MVQKLKLMKGSRSVARASTVHIHPPQDSPWQEREGGRGLLLQRPMGQSPSHLLWRELMDLTCIRNPGSIRSKGEKAADLLWLTGLYEREVKHRT